MKFDLKFEISDVKKYLVKFGVRLFDLPGKHHQKCWGEFRGKFQHNFRKLRFKFRVSFRKLSFKRRAVLTHRCRNSREWRDFAALRACGFSLPQDPFYLVTLVPTLISFVSGHKRQFKGANKHPLTRNYYEKNSLRIIVS